MATKTRWVKYFDLELKSVPKGTAVPPMEEILLKVKQEFDKNLCLDALVADSKTLRIQGMEIDSSDTRTATLLLCLADRNSEDKAVSGLDGSGLRILRKKKNEAGNVAAHVVISLSPVKPDFNTYRILIESVEHLSPSSVKPYLVRTIKKASEDKVVDDKGKEKDYYVQPVFTNHLSGELEYLMANGRIAQAKLLSEDYKDGVGETPSYIARKEHSLNLYMEKQKKDKKGKIKKESEKKQPSQQSIFSYFVQKLESSKDFDKLRLYFQYPDGKQQYAEISQEIDDSLEIALTKKDRIEVPYSGVSAVEKICGITQKKITDLMIKDRNKNINSNESK